MITSLHTQGGRRRLATALGGAVAALVMAIYAAVLMPASAHADPNYLEYSADNTAWGGMDQIPALTGTLAPGQEVSSTFHARNSGTEAGTLQVYLGNWTTSANMQAYVRAEINDAAGVVVDLVNGVAVPGTELQSIHLAPGQSAKVMLVVGMPDDAGNETQASAVDPHFSLDFELDAAAVKEATSVTISGATAANKGTNVELIAAVAPNSATGQVQFRDGGVALGDPVDLVNGVATVNRSFNEDGAHPITVEYLGDDAHLTSTSAVHTVTVSSVTPEPGGTGSAGSIDMGSLSSLLGGS